MDGTTMAADAGRILVVEDEAGVGQYPQPSPTLEQPHLENFADEIFSSAKP